MFKVGIVGAGNMGQAILKGLIKTSMFKPQEIVIFDIDKQKVEEMVNTYEVAAATDIRNLVNLSETVFICVKPKDFETSIMPAREFFRENHTVVSVMAGIKISQIKQVVNRGYIVRTMPNTPALIGEGVVGVAYDFEDDGIKQKVRSVLSSLGLVVEVDEPLLDTITGLSGSGPAYVFLFIDALAQGGVKMGLSYQQALQVATQTVVGSAKLLKETGEHPAVLRDRVTSPAGTTIYGIHELERRGLRDAVISAVEAATKRSRELSDKP